MLTVRDSFPEFSLTALMEDKTVSTVTNKTHEKKWRVIFFYPRDSTVVCASEVSAFARLYKEFAERGAVVLGCSADAVETHLNWRETTPEMKEIPYPLLADPERILIQKAGVLHSEKNVSVRATFIVDPDNIIRCASATDMTVGRNVREVLRVLDALKSDDKCPAKI